MERKTNAEKREAIRDVPHLYDLSEAVLDPLVRSARFGDYERDDRIWRAGGRATHVTILVDGWVKIGKWVGAGARVVVRLAGGGEMVGGLAAFEGGEHPTEAAVLEDTTVVRIAREVFLDVLHSETDLMEATLKGALDRNFGLLERLHELSVSSSRERLAMVFCKLAYEHGIRRSREGGVVVDIPVALSRSDLAEMINMRVETTIRKMSEWRERGIVETRADGFSVHALDEIEAIVESTGRVPE